MLGAADVRRKRPTRFVIPAGRRSGAAAPGFPRLAGFPPKEPVRLHLDLHASEQAVHVERLVTLGATRVDERPYPDGADFIVTRDPDGNEFFVIDPSRTVSAAVGATRWRRGLLAPAGTWPPSTPGTQFLSEQASSRSIRSS
jgi:hypothetical protein